MNKIRNTFGELKKFRLMNDFFGITFSTFPSKSYSEFRRNNSFPHPTDSFTVIFATLISQNLRLFRKSK